ncbi:MAG: hypothetical protein R8K46_01520 [Mariprofundaceae bacterium]
MGQDTRVENAWTWDLSAPEQWLSLLGSALILFAYGLTVASPERRRLYFSLSAAGAVLLFVVGLIYRNLGILILETAWIGLNVWGLLRRSRSRRDA